MTPSEFIDYISTRHKINKTEAVQWAATAIGISEWSIWKWLNTKKNASKQSLRSMELIVENNTLRDELEKYKTPQASKTPRGHNNGD